TGIIIKDNNFTVIGSGMVIVFDGHHLHHNNEPILKQGTPMTVTHMITHVLSNGDQYNLTTRMVEALPISSPFV
ncbi:MAG: cyanophycinase, partial [Putridiphycobacter sp.]|nr:cyanophycinase [Putridiphycobacter sp.]